MTHEFPQRLTALVAFAKTHTPSPFMGALKRFRLPNASQDIAIQLRELHLVRRMNATSANQIQQIDENIANRLAAEQSNATELVELKTRPPNEKAIATFDSDARSLASLVRHARDKENSSALGLAFAVWFRTAASQTGRDSQNVRQEIYSQIHQVFKSLAQQNLLNDRTAMAFCQSVCAVDWEDRGKPSTLLTYLRKTGFIESLLEATKDIEDVAVVTQFANFMLSQDENYNDFSAIEFLQRFSLFDQRVDIVRQLAQLYRRSRLPIANLDPVFANFRFPTGISIETVQSWSKVRSGKDLLICIAKLVRPCHKTHIPFLSPHAQTISHYALRTLNSLLSDDTDQVEIEEYRKRWQAFLSAISGIELGREEVRNRFIELVSDGNRLKLLLRRSQRPKLIRQIAGDGSNRENWVLAKLLEAAGAMSPEDYSMCSICLGSGYLFDTEGRFCNRKTFRDFATFIDRDIQNLRAFIDPKYAANLESESVGHIKRLMSFIREFLIDPQNAHYTNFEVYRTKPFSKK